MWILLTFIALLLFLYWYTYPRLGEVLLNAYQQRALQQASLVRRRYAINGISLSVLETEGARDKSKPLLMLVHGFTGDNTVWLPLAALFKDEYHIVIPDLPGHGQTGFSSEWHYGIDDYANILNALIWRLGYQKATIVGNSMGGYISAWMARHRSTAVASSILLCPAGLPANKKSRLDTMLDKGQNPFFITRRRGYYRLLAMSMASGPYIPKVVKDVLADQHIQRVDEYQRVFADFVDTGYMNAEELAKTRVPTLIIWGGKDGLLDVSALDNWTSAMECDYEIFHDTGHMPMLEAPGRTYQRIQNFIQRQRMAQAA
ncbi:alpha/beta fold hydrolase [Salinimonas sediminis]|uniref:Alpha/beta hydrolase n=1 Tax=Salinimonas sediminis TaxID=2303538 RepID=A0A346NM67_9ALTE|nr:alpha/beta hydrolase [Salinimonas sediminis]AXR06624.1 alpha/beta hydrolase [Salinimonas sediminis]